MYCVLFYLTVVNATKEKAYQELKMRSMKEPSLILKAHVLTSETGNVVGRCYGCIQRERKGLVKKVKQRVNTLRKKGRPIPEGMDYIPPEPTVEEDSKRILQFFCEDTLDFSAGEVIIPARITCYCRHHKEPTGFVISVGLYDSITNQQVSYFNLLIIDCNCVIYICYDH